MTNQQIAELEQQIAESLTTRPAYILERFNPQPGLWRIRREAVHLFPSANIGYVYKIERVVNTRVCITPILTIAQGKIPTFSQQARLCTWANWTDLERVQVD